MQHTENHISEFIKYGVKAAVAAVLLLGGTVSAAAAEQGDWKVRLRGLMINPDESSSVGVIGGTVDVTNSYVPELDITYYLTNKLSLELVLAVAEHSAVARGTTLGDVDLGDTKIIPPSLTLQYHPLEGQTISPYVGAGVNYTIFFDEDLPSSGPVTDIHYDDSFGLTLQAGIDFKITDQWSFNVDAKRIWLNSDVTMNSAAITADVDIDPWTFGVGFGFTF